MKTTKRDKFGYCIYVQSDGINVVKMETSSFSVPGFSSTWLEKLLGGNLDSLELGKSVEIQKISQQFSDPTINIFAESDGTNKELPLMVKTQTGGSVLGDVVILGSDSKGETILLTESQGQLAINELGFYNDYKGINFVDAETNENKYLTTEQHPQALKNLLTLLIDYCISEDVQLLTRAQDPNDNKSDMALVMCLHGDPEFIRGCHKLLSDFIKSHQKDTEEV